MKFSDKDIEENEKYKIIERKKAMRNAGLAPPEPNEMGGGGPSAGGAGGLGGGGGGGGSTNGNGGNGGTGCLLIYY